MNLVQRLHRAALRRVSPRLASSADPSMSAGDAARILLRAGLNLVRGTCLKPRLGSSDGRLFVARGARVSHAAHLFVGRDVKLEELAEIHCLSRRGIRLGNHVTIGRGASIRPSSYYGGELGEGLVVGDGSAIGPFAWIGASGFVRIGSGVLLGPRVVIVPENHRFDDRSSAINEQGVERADVTIEDDCWIGANATILAGVTIGRGAVVAAGAVVNRDVEPASIVAGVPARHVRYRGERAA